MECGAHRMAPATDVVSARPTFEQLLGLPFWSCSNRFDVPDRQILEEVQHENDVNPGSD